VASYVFEEAPHDAELLRLRRIEAALDPASIRWLAPTAIEPGCSCLEVGAGAGSIARWLGQAVGVSGRVVAVDVDPRFLAKHANVEVVAQDIREREGRGEHDVVHARYLLVHLADFSRALDRMIASLRPGGWLVLEEPDFASARFAGGPPQLAGAFDRVNAAIARMFESRGMDPALGLHLPAILAERGLTVCDVECDTHLCRGGSAIAQMMKASTEQLRDKYVGTGLADDADIEGYRCFADDPSAWGVYYATVRIRARR
jgi:SAM-dependent methyltransferase